MTEAIPGFEELWAERMQSANEKRRKITPTAERQQLSRIEQWLEGGTPVADIVELIEDAIAGAWQGLKLEWLEGRRNGGGRGFARDPSPGAPHPPGPPPDLWKPLAQRLRDDLGGTIFRAEFGGAKVAKTEHGRLVLGVESADRMQRLEERFRPAVDRAAAALPGPSFEVLFVLEEAK